MSKWVKMKPDKAVRYSLGVPKTMVMEPGMHLTARVPPGGVELVATSAIGGQIFLGGIEKNKTRIRTTRQTPNRLVAILQTQSMGQNGKMTARDGRLP